MAKTVDPDPFYPLSYSFYLHFFCDHVFILVSGGWKHFLPLIFQKPIMIVMETYVTNADWPLCSGLCMWEKLAINGHKLVCTLDFFYRASCSFRIHQSEWVCPVWCFSLLFSSSLKNTKGTTTRLEHICVFDREGVCWQGVGFTPAETMSTLMWMCLKYVFFSPLSFSLEFFTSKHLLNITKRLKHIYDFSMLGTADRWIEGLTVQAL